MCPDCWRDVVPETNEGVKVESKESITSTSVVSDL